MSGPTEHQLWRHPGNGEVWAVRVEYGTLTGVAGPLMADAMRGDLAELSYEDHPDDLEWFLRDSESFEMVEMPRLNPPS